MKNGFVRKIAIGMAAAWTLLASGIVVAETAAVDKRGYLVDSRGNVVKNSYNQCWRTGYWTPELAIAECDPDLVKKEVPVAEVPPAPVPPPAPVKHVIQVRISAKNFFDFDRSVIRPEGKKILDEQVAAVLKEHPEVKRLVITGHTDRIGTVEYNQRLSERRAAAGKAYLEQQGIPGDLIVTVGKGKSEPDPVANTAVKCKGVHGRDNIIACLQPDRRITIESEESAPGSQ